LRHVFRPDLRLKLSLGLREKLRMQFVKQRVSFHERVHARKGRRHDRLLALGDWRAAIRAASYPAALVATNPIRHQVAFPTAQPCGWGCAVIQLSPLAHLRDETGGPGLAWL